MSKQIGTKHAHYASADEGPFRCDHCQHYHAGGTCDLPEMAEDAKAGLVKKDAHQRPMVETAGCCNYFDPKHEEHAVRKGIGG